MSRIKHIAIRTPDVEQTASFYKDVFELTEAGKGRNGVYLTDGHINLAILKMQESGPNAGKMGIDHFGFQVEDIDAAAAKLESVGSEALAVHTPPANADGSQSYYEAKYLDPVNQVVDVTHTGWVGTD